MKLFILNETFEIGNTEESIEQVFEYIRQAIDETEYNFSYMIVDGEEIYDEFEIFIEENLKSIKEVKVKMLTNKEIVTDNLENINSYLKAVIPMMKTLSDDFYNDPDARNWEQVNNLIEEVSYMKYIRETIDDMGSLSELVSNYYAWHEFTIQVGKLNIVPEQYKLALENVDAQKIGDIISTQIKPAFEIMHDKLETLLEK